MSSRLNHPRYYFQNFQEEGLGKSTLTVYCQPHSMMNLESNHTSMISWFFLNPAICRTWMSKSFGKRSYIMFQQMSCRTKFLKELSYVFLIASAVMIATTFQRRRLEAEHPKHRWRDNPAVVADLYKDGLYSIPSEEFNLFQFHPDFFDGIVNLSKPLLCGRTPDDCFLVRQSGMSFWARRRLSSFST